MNHKYSVDKNKIIKLKDLEMVQQTYTVNKLTCNKKLIEINHLQTINDSIKRTNNEKNLNFLNPQCFYLNYNYITLQLNF